MSEEVKQGRPWKNVAKFVSYEEANVKREELAKTTHEVKVVRLSIANNAKPFVVKTRDIENEKPPKKSKPPKK